MKLFILNVIIFFMISVPSWAYDSTRKTIFYQPSEYNFLVTYRDKNLHLLKDSTEGENTNGIENIYVNTQGPESNLMLNSIYYQDATHWTLWLNQHPYTKAELPKRSEVLSINNHEVTLRWPLNETEVTRPFKLMIGDVFDLNLQSYTSKSTTGKISVQPPPHTP